MRLAYFDIFAGISGDMLLGALVDLGLPLSHLEAELARLDLGGYSLAARGVMRGMLGATKVDVTLTTHEAHGHPHPHEEGTRPHEHHGHVHPHEGAHPHEHHGHAHPHEHHGHAHPHEHHGHAHPHEHHGHRSVGEITRMIEASSLSPRVKARSIAVFRKLAEAEARIHRQDVETVHFHEVGAVDAIVDIVGCAIGLEWFGIERVLASPVPLNQGGFVHAAHGCLPLPAPAVLELLSGVPVRPVEIDHEIVTPTGAAIVRTLAEAFGPFPPMRIERTGYGAGTHQGGEIPNLLRIVIGEGEGQEARGGMLLMEANIDDMNPQGYDHVLERLFEAGAADAYLSPIQMKKNRPAVLLSVLLPEGRKEPIARILFEETTTIGLRFHPVARITLDRHVEEVETPFGRIPVKIARQGGEVMNLAPEYDACKAAAIGHSVPLKRIYLAVWEALARSGLSSQSSGASSAPSSGDPSTLSGTGQSRSR